MTLEELKYKQTLSGDEKLTLDELEVILDLEDENSRMGNFEKVYPLAENVVQYGKYFEIQRYQNALVSAYLLSSEKVKSTITKDYPIISQASV